MENFVQKGTRPPSPHRTIWSYQDAFPTPWPPPVTKNRSFTPSLSKSSLEIVVGGTDALVSWAESYYASLGFVPSGAVDVNTTLVWISPSVPVILHVHKLSCRNVRRVRRAQRRIPITHAPKAAAVQQARGIWTGFPITPVVRMPEVEPPIAVPVRHVRSLQRRACLGRVWGGYMYMYK